MRKQRLRQEWGEPEAGMDSGHSCVVCLASTEQGTQWTVPGTFHRRQRPSFPLQRGGLECKFLVKRGPRAGVSPLWDEADRFLGTQ